MNNALLANVNNALFKLYFKVQDLMKREEGQDLVEYGLIAGLVAVGSVTFIGTIGSGVKIIFSKIASDVTSAASIT